ncbi:4Fe-4S binding protein [Methanothermococcus okinawensis]|uniref:4Fe-4S ferredoxin iron-sulfur binding domain-containing protein n=1 Tax=Methanothermococcus okinawensis (strain DSM 14208 / JCM 11175 / IH1) TaxID=647113 RepID=F8ALG8_METOI|nr:4Fe-4S binding protein [Methanothermococcus okinawensis]AEH06563.1 4Fe-4S ferredoxin iron-sulfur binding domain-containing protein [Methanothermococcus okinawensis IH1]
MVINKGNLLKKIFKNVFKKNEFQELKKTEHPILDNCIACSLCVKVCPTNAIKIFKFRNIICSHCGACMNVCPNNAILLDRFTIDKDKCTKCGYCALVCSIPIIKNEIPMPNTPVITNECNNCGLCITKCPNKAIYFENDEKGNCKISINPEKCENCSICIDFCPMHAMLSPADYVKSCIIKVDIDSCIFCKECEEICPMKK